MVWVLASFPPAHEDLPSSFCVNQMDSAFTSRINESNRKRDRTSVYYAFIAGHECHILPPSSSLTALLGWGFSCTF